jgi:hypothetical protein
VLTGSTGRASCIAGAVPTTVPLHAGGCALLHTACLLESYPAAHVQACFWVQQAALGSGPDICWAEVKLANTCLNMVWLQA